MGRHVGRNKMCPHLLMLQKRERETERQIKKSKLAPLIVTSQYWALVSP